MTEEKLLDHVISRVEPQILYYVQVRHPQTTSNLLHIIDKYEERNMQDNWRVKRGNNQYSDNSRPHREFNRFEGGRQGGSRNGALRVQNDQSSHLKFLSDRCESGGDRSQSTENPPDKEHRTIRISSLRMTPVDLLEANIKVNDLVLVETHFISAAGRRVVGKFMPKFEGPYRVLEVRNNNLIIWKKERRVSVNIDQVRVYHPRQSDTISFDSNDKTLYEGKRSSNGTSRSQPGKSKSSKKTSSDEGKVHKSNKGTTGLEDLRLKPKVRSNGSVERTDKKQSKICKKRSLQGSEHGDQKRPTPVPPQEIKRTVPSSVASKNHKFRRQEFNSSQGK
ncbi:uncharacterized protein TNCV_1452581 [Trichonephila clavipes]|nr:uncharacterized protein TNCV_1452581 [Trichonephila clavipes]